MISAEKCYVNVTIKLYDCIEKTENVIKRNRTFQKHNNKLTSTTISLEGHKLKSNTQNVNFKQTVTKLSQINSIFVILLNDYFRITVIHHSNVIMLTFLITIKRCLVRIFSELISRCWWLLHPVRRARGKSTR